MGSCMWPVRMNVLSSWSTQTRVKSSSDMGTRFVSLMMSQSHQMARSTGQTSSRAGVGRLGADGSMRSQMVDVGVNPIVFSSDGRLFAALAFLGDALYELDPNLIEPPRSCWRRIWVA